MGLKRSCCGCSLKTGSLIIGYVYVVLSLIGVLMSLMSASVLASRWNQQDTEGLDQQPQLLETILVRAYMVAAVICIKMLIVSSLMVHGVRRSKPALVLPWIMFVAAGMVIQSGAALYAALAAGGLGSNAMWVGASLAVILAFCMELYILMVVTSHYHSMKKSSLLEDDDEEQMMM